MQVLEPSSGESTNTDASIVDIQPRVKTHQQYTDDDDDDDDNERIRDNDHEHATNDHDHDRAARIPRIDVSKTALDCPPCTSHSFVDHGRDYKTTDLHYKCTTAYKG